MSSETSTVVQGPATGQRLRPVFELSGPSSGSSGSASGTLSCTGPGMPPAPRAPPPPGRPSPATGVLARNCLWAQRIRGTTGGRNRRRPLVDGLVGADVAQPGRPVGGQHQQRDAAVMGLEHRGMQVRHRRARCGDDRRRSTGSPGQAERQEPGRAFVDPHMQPDPAGGIGVVQCHRQRGVPGTRGEHRVGDAAGDQLVDEDTGQRRRRVHLPLSSLTAPAASSGAEEEAQWGPRGGPVETEQRPSEAGDVAQRGREEAQWGPRGGPVETEQWPSEAGDVAQRGREEAQRDRAGKGLVWPGTGQRLAGPAAPRRIRWDGTASLLKEH